MTTGLLDSSRLLPEYPQQQKSESDAVNDKRLHADTLDKSDKIVNTDIGNGSRQYHAGYQSQPLDFLDCPYQPEDFKTGCQSNHRDRHQERETRCPFATRSEEHT